MMKPMYLATVFRIKIEQARNLLVVLWLGKFIDIDNHSTKKREDI